MSTSGGSQFWQGRPHAFAIAFAVALPALLTFFSASAQALTPPPADKAEIVYSNGGRIVQVFADGSDRKVWTNAGKVTTPGTFGPLGDRFPKVSPDGSRVLFTRGVDDAAPDNEFLVSGKNMLLNLETGKVREVLPGNRRVSYSNLAWLPGTERVVAARKVSGRTTERSVVSVGLDGSGARMILKFRNYGAGMPKDNWNFEAARLAVSPDGESLLMTTIDIRSEHNYRLELVNLTNGKRKLIAKAAHSGAWSPDGSHFVFVRDRDGVEVCDWSFDCTPSGDLYTASADGSGITKLTDTSRDEASPSYSPEGSRIVFSGTVHSPEDRTTAEIFSMKAEGGCTIWLTNGSPASQDPAFVPGSGDHVAPGNCESGDRPAVAEGGLNPTWKKGFGKRLWLGPESSQGMLSADVDLVFFGFSLYGDCPSFRNSDCGPGATVVTDPVCFSMGSWPDIAARLVSSKEKMKRRGVWIMPERKNGELQTTVYSGRRTASIMAGLDLADEEIGELPAAARLALVDDLRVEGRKWVPNLPPLVIPRADFRLARAVTRQVRKTSVREVMKSKRMTRRQVMNRLAFERNLKRLGGVGRTGCPDTDDPWGMD